MAKEILEKTLFECTQGAHNKFYEIVLWIEKNEDPPMYYITARWGTRKGNWQHRGGQRMVKEQAYSEKNIRNIYTFMCVNRESRGYVKVKIPAEEPQKDRKQKYPSPEFSDDPMLRRFLNMEI